MGKEKKKFSKWRLLGLIPIAIWLYNLIINLFMITERFGPQNAPYAWHYNLWSCPMMGLILGLGILLDNKFLTGAGALWGLFPVFLADILLITPAARELSAAQGFSIPFLKMTPEFQMMYEQWVGEMGTVLIVIEEFATHWIGNFLFALIGLIIVGIGKWSFVGTALSFLFTAWFTNTICPFSPPSPEGAPSLFIQAIPMTVIWIILNISIYGFTKPKELKQKIFYGVLTIYSILAILIFNSISEESYNVLLLCGFFAIYFVGNSILNWAAFSEKVKTLFKKRVKGLLYVAMGYLLLFSLFFFVAMRPTLIAEGGKPLFAYIMFGLIPFALLMILGIFIIPLFKKK